MSTKLSVVINTKNAAETLKDTLNSVRWADEIVVVDMMSSDRTKQIAQKFTNRIFNFKEDVSYVEPARNYAIAKAKNDWVLIVDADEVIPKQLADKISTLMDLDPEIACFYLSRKNVIFGKWIEKTGWWPDYQPRLFNKNHVVWHDEIHSEPQISGQIEYLPASEELAIEHHNYRSISDYISRLDRYTSVTAAEKTSTLQITPAKLIDTFREELMRRLFAEKGIEEDVHGVALSFLQSMYQMVVELKQWENQGHNSSHQDSQQVLEAMKRFQSDLAYWIASEKQAQETGLSSAVWKLRKKLKK